MQSTHIEAPPPALEPYICAGQLLGPDKGGCVHPDALQTGFWFFANLEETVPATPSVSTSPPGSVCMHLLLTPLSSPEEDLPWQGPEKKEEGCRNKSCHSAEGPWSPSSAWLPR